MFVYDNRNLQSLLEFKISNQRDKAASVGRQPVIPYDQYYEIRSSRLSAEENQQFVLDQGKTLVWCFPRDVPLRILIHDVEGAAC